MEVELFLAQEEFIGEIKEKHHVKILEPSSLELPNGTEISNSAEINRGYKSGYNIIQTKGAPGQNSGDGGNGGSGATGGSGGVNASSGGGGSGYTDGSVTVVSTQVGGSTEQQKSLFDLYK